MITLGDCNGCVGCDEGGGVVCDLVAFSNLANGMPATLGEIVGSSTEGIDIVFFVVRYPNCYLYPGTPAFFESEEGYPATDIIPENQYFFDASQRDFWQNQSGTMTLVATPSWFKVGSISGNVAISIPTCECSAHMITDTNPVAFSFANGDDTSVQISIPTTCPGPPVFWGCRDQPGAVEIAALTFSGVSATGGCVTTGNYARGLVSCTHTVPYDGWGEFPYLHRCFSATYQPSYGFGEFEVVPDLGLPDGEFEIQCKQGDGNRYLRYDYEKTVDSVVTSALQVEFFEQGNVVKELRWTGTSPYIGGPYVDANIRLLGTPELWQPSALTPASPFVTVPQPARIWTGTSVTFTASVTSFWAGGLPVDFLWSTGDSSTDGNPTYAASLTITDAEIGDSGNYNVQATNAFADVETTADAELEVIESATVTDTTFSLSYIGPAGGDGTEAVVESAALSVAGSTLPLDATTVDAFIAQAESDFPYSGGYYLWDGVLPDYTWKIRATQDGFDDPAFDPSKTYSYTGSTLPATPYNPDDWTETADTGFDFEQVADPLYTQESGPFSGRVCSAASLEIGFSEGNRRGYIVKNKASIDASNSMVNNPEPARVFVSVENYEDTAHISSEAEVDITDSTLDIEVTTLGGATFLNEKRFQIRDEYINAPFCGPAPSGVFICHPGLTSDPCA